MAFRGPRDNPKTKTGNCPSEPWAACVGVGCGGRSLRLEFSPELQGVRAPDEQKRDAMYGGDHEIADHDWVGKRSDGKWSGDLVHDLYDQ